MAELLIWGASGHARVVADAARLAGHTVAGFLDDSPARHGERFAGAAIVGGGGQLEALRASGVARIHVAIGNCAVRSRLGETAERSGFELVTIVHPRAVVAADVTVDRGTFVAAGAVVNPGAKIGRLVIVNTGATVDHDCVIGDGAHIGPGVHMGGAAQIDELAWIGIGAALRDRIHVGRTTIVGAGAVVVSDIPDDVVAFGVPARIVRPRHADE